MLGNDPVFFGQLNWNAIVPTSRVPALAHRPQSVRYISSGRRPKWSAYIIDCGRDASFWQVRLADPAKAAALSGSAGRGGLGLPGVKAAVLPLLRCSPELEAVVEATPESQIFERCIMGQWPPPGWRSPGGRVVIAGDAAHAPHPVPGHGANLAFESVAVLSRLLADCGGDWAAALRAFEARQKPRADVVMRWSAQAGLRQRDGAPLPLSPEARAAMDVWMQEFAPEPAPPSEVVRYLDEQDPFAVLAAEVES